MGKLFSLPLLLYIFLVLGGGSASAAGASKLEELFRDKGQAYSTKDANTALEEDVTNGRVPPEFIRALLLQEYSWHGYPFAIGESNFANIVKMLKKIEPEMWTAPSDIVGEAMGIAVLRFLAFPHPQLVVAVEKKDYPPGAEFIQWLFSVSTNLSVLYDKAVAAVEKYHPATIFELQWMKHFSGQRVFELEGERNMRSLSRSQLKSYLPYLKLLVDLQAGAPWDATRKLYGINFFLHNLSRAKSKNVAAEENFPDYIAMIVEAMAENSTDFNAFMTTLIYVNSSPNRLNFLNSLTLPKTVIRLLKQDALKYFYYHIDKLRSDNTVDSDRKYVSLVQSVLKQILPQLAHSLGLLVMAHPNAFFYRRLLRLLLETKTFSVVELDVEMSGSEHAEHWSTFFAPKATNSTGIMRDLFTKKFHARFLEVVTK